MGAADDNLLIAQHFIDRLHASDVKLRPYPHVYVTRCFPQWYYERMREALPGDEAYSDRQFENRMMCRAAEAGDFWAALERWMLSSPVINAVLELFPGLDLDGKLAAEVRLVRDKQGYKIKPHTDIKAKLISLLFYLPGHEADAGTTVMVPREPGFSSDGTRRFEFEAFDNVYTAPFAPNSMFGFPRSDISFHGVAPTTLDQRDVLLLNIYRYKRDATP
jgi:hypothetical protein